MAEDQGPSLEDHPILKEFKDVISKILGLPPKRDIEFSI